MEIAALIQQCDSVEIGQIANLNVERLGLLCVAAPPRFDAASLLPADPRTRVRVGQTTPRSASCWSWCAACCRCGGSARGGTASASVRAAAPGALPAGAGASAHHARAALDVMALVARRSYYKLLTHNWMFDGCVLQTASESGERGSPALFAQSTGHGRGRHAIVHHAQLGTPGGRPAAPPTACRPRAVRLTALPQMGSSRFACFAAATFAASTMYQFALVRLLQPLEYLSSGPFGLVFALLVQYYRASATPRARVVVADRRPPSSPRAQCTSRHCGPACCRSRA